MLPTRPPRPGVVHVAAEPQAAAAFDHRRWTAAVLGDLRCLDAATAQEKRQFTTVDRARAQASALAPAPPQSVS